MIKNVTYYFNFDVEGEIIILCFQETTLHQSQIIAELVVINCQFFVIDFMIEHSFIDFLHSIP